VVDGVLLAISVAVKVIFKEVVHTYRPFTVEVARASSSLVVIVQRVQILGIAKDKEVPSDNPAAEEAMENKATSSVHHTYVSNLMTSLATTK
jgi:hypothetical protein